MSPEQRFWTRVRKGDGCWEWTGARSSGRVRYGNFHPTNGQAVSTHRFAYRLAYGAIPPGMCVCHRCDNPICVRPDHLFLGTVADNNRDMYAKGRGNTQRRPALMEQLQVALRASGHQIKGEQCHAAKLTVQTVRELRARYAAGEMNKAALGRAYGISGVNVLAIVTRQTWKHV